MTTLWSDIPAAQMSPEELRDLRSESGRPDLSVEQAEAYRRRKTAAYSVEERLKPTLEQLRCDDCAFTEGTSANRYEWTALKAKLCVEACEPFSCHRREGLCAGWVEAANNMAESGFYKSEPEWRQALRHKLLELMDRAQSGEQIDIFKELKELA